MQNKKEYAYNQSSGRRSAVFPDMWQMEKERITWVGSNIYAACINFLLNYIQWHLSLFKSIYLFLLISISSPAVWITKINKCISETLFFLLNFSYQLGNSALLWLETRLGGFLLVTPYIPSNITHGIVEAVSQKINLIFQTGIRKFYCSSPHEPTR